MKLNVSYCLLLAVTLWPLLACQDKRNPDPLQSSPKTDSLITVTIPDFATIVTSSVTPIGKLDKINTVTFQQYTPSSPVNEGKSTQQFLYDAQGRITGHTYPDSPSRGIDNAYIYEYKDNLPYRIFLKGAEYGAKEPSFYSITELVHNQAGREVARLSYYVDKQGNARLQQRYKLGYNERNQLSEIKDANGFFVGQRFIYEGQNLQFVEHRYADGKSIGMRNEFHYDTGLNPLKGLYWSWNGDRFFDLSANNVVSSRYVYDDPIFQPTEPMTYTNEYDPSGRLLRKALVWPQGQSMVRISESYIYK